MNEKQRIFNIKGDYIESQTIHVHGNYYAGVQTVKDKVTKVAKAKDEAQVANDLLPFFKMKQDAVTDFLAAVGGMKNRDITRLVNSYIKSKAIDTTMAKGKLFDILQTHKIYNGAKSTWNDQVDFK